MAVLHRLRPKWLAISLSDAARSAGVSPQRLSRLCTRCLLPFANTLSTSTRMGRPKCDSDAKPNQRELLLLRALLDVATAILAKVPLRGSEMRSLVVGAWLRLRAEHPMTQQHFCQTLAIPTRTLRHWVKTTPANVGGTKSWLQDSTKKNSKRKRSLRRGRFNFKVTLPGTQIAADTTDLKSFGTPLKLIAAQDIGGRDQNLFDSIIVDDHENAERVVQVLTKALNGREGIQVVTDQGTPYMAEKTCRALDQLGAEFAPQREADPIAKATIERAFGTVKQIAQPILNITNSIARSLPQLADSELAKATTSMFITALLRAYQAGARATKRALQDRDNTSVEDIARAADDSRQRARAYDNSARLLLAHIHGAYDIDVPLQKFTRLFRRFPLPVIHDAEKAFASQAHRDNIKKRCSYFAAIIRKCNDDYRQRRKREKVMRESNELLEREARQFERQKNQQHSNPAQWLRSALDAIAALWRPGKNELLFGGVGLGTAWLRQSIDLLIELYGTTSAIQIITGVAWDFQRDNLNVIGKNGVGAVLAVLQNRLSSLPKEDIGFDIAQNFAAAIVCSRGPPTRPMPPLHLRT